MNVDDIVCMGATPLFFLDYLGIGKLTPKVAAAVIKGVATACKKAGCVLLGGETAELPGLYAEGEYDLAGFAVGIVERDKIIDGSAVQAGDVIIGLASSGLHSNGYSLARKALLEVAGLKLKDHIDSLSCTLGEELLRPTRIYCQDLVTLFDEEPLPHALAHITGGGWSDNVARAIPKGLTAVLNCSAIPVPPIFRLIQDSGGIAPQEMYHTFNMGMGMAIIVAPGDLQVCRDRLTAAGQQYYIVGEIITGERPVDLRL